MDDKKPGYLRRYSRESMDLMARTRGLFQDRQERFPKRLDTSIYPHPIYLVLPLGVKRLEGEDH
jgi:hypothetical protein